MVLINLYNFSHQKSLEFINEKKNTRSTKKVIYVQEGGRRYQIIIH